jgi:XTP/dITP diphosphohydrolase
MIPESIVLGTRNQGKRRELAELLAPLGIQLSTLADHPQAIDVEETGTTFAENARLKSTVQATRLGQWVLGEDSGLTVDALDGAPGVFSARFAGPTATDESNNALLRERLAGVPPERRGAQYHCHLTLADPQGVVHIEASGTCRGRIATEPRGTSGFGYDPLFEILEYHATFGELGPSIKSVISHRAKAIRQFVSLLLHDRARLIARGDRA